MRTGPPSVTPAGSHRKRGPGGGPRLHAIQGHLGTLLAGPALPRDRSHPCGYPAATYEIGRSPGAHVPGVAREPGRLWKTAEWVGLVRDPADRPAVYSKRWWIDLTVIVVIVVIAVVVGTRLSTSPKWAV